MRPLSHLEELGVLKSLGGGKTPPSLALESILSLTHQLRASEDASLRSIANSLSTRQLLRIARRQQMFPGESVRHAIHKACLARFLPTLPREALDKLLQESEELEQHKSSSQAEVVCRISADGKRLTLGKTTTDVYSPDSKTKIPETLFYDTPQNVATMEEMLQDFLLGE